MTSAGSVIPQEVVKVVLGALKGGQESFWEEEMI